MGMYETVDFISIKYWLRLLKENIFSEEIEVRKLMKKNNHEINRSIRSMHQIIKYEVLKKSFEINVKWFGVMITGEE
jgi:hypothetical protein